MRSILVCCVLSLLVCPMLCSGAMESDAVRLHGLQKRLAEAVSVYWESRDLLEKSPANEPEVEAKFNDLSKRLKEANRWFGGEIVSALTNADWDEFRLFARAYASVAPEARPAFKEALDMGAAAYLQVPLPPNAGEFKEYFPGYGYGEPGYRYRRGKELRRDYKGDFWQYEEHVYAKETTHTVMVSIDVLGILKGLLGQGLISNLSVGEPQTIPVNGDFVIAYQATFTTMQSMTTKAHRQYEVYRVWFELMRTQDSGWNPNPIWETCGETFQIMYEPTGGVFMPTWPTPPEGDDSDDR